MVFYKILLQYHTYKLKKPYLKSFCVLSRAWLSDSAPNFEFNSTGFESHLHQIDFEAGLFGTHSTFWNFFFKKVLCQINQLQNQFDAGGI